MMNKNKLIILVIILIFLLNIVSVLAPPAIGRYSYNFIDILKYSTDDCTGTTSVVCSGLVSGGNCQLYPSECYRIEASVTCSAAGGCPEPMDNVYHDGIINLYDTIDTVNDIFFTPDTQNSTPPPDYTCTDDCVGGSYSLGRVDWDDAPTLLINKNDTRHVYFIKTKNDCSNAINTQFYACSSAGCQASAQSVITLLCDGVTDSYIEIDLNSSTTEENVDYWQYSINNGTNITFSPNTTIFHEAEGNFNITVYVHDLAGNINSTIQYYTIAKVPKINILSPENTTYYNTLIDLNVTSDETIDTWWYSLNSGVNTTFTPNATIDGILGSNNIVVWANDTSGYENYSIVYFAINMTDINWSIWIGSTWALAEDYYVDFRCTSTETNCEPDDQDSGSSQCIYQVCNNGTENAVSVKMNLSSVCPNMDFKADDDYTSADSIILTTSLQEIHGALNINTCIPICMWADYDNPDTCATYPEPYIEMI